MRGGRAALLRRTTMARGTRPRARRPRAPPGSLRRAPSLALRSPLRPLLPARARCGRARGALRLRAPQTFGAQNSERCAGGAGRGWAGLARGSAPSCPARLRGPCASRRRSGRTRAVPAPSRDGRGFLGDGIAAGPAGPSASCAAFNPAQTGYGAARGWLWGGGAAPPRLHLHQLLLVRETGTGGPVPLAPPWGAGTAGATAGMARLRAGHTLGLASRHELWSWRKTK